MDTKISKFFPLDSTESVIKLFKSQLENDEKNVDLTLISICLGFFENVLCNRENRENKCTFPTLDYETFEELYKKFKSIVSLAETPSSQTKGKSKTVESQEVKLPTREKIKKISDVIWNSLLRSSYKDRVHLQSVYSYLTGNKLDSFGVALVTLASCQLLNYDVHLALSEDHVWLVFGNTGETMEITWHGKIAEDKRGHSVSPGIEAHTWLYLAGNPVICTRFMELAVIVLSINPHLNPTSVCAELADLQQQLLWILYDAGHLNNYPMSLMYLGEMEENHPTLLSRIKCEALYEQAIQSSITYYKNHHVYPYSCKGNYYYRKENFRDAFRCWTNASDVIRLYNYSRDDEEIYKEFLDIANEQIPQIMKTESSGHSAKSILRDPHCFANLLRFYDGICQWEEGSQTPILHIGWAKQLCFSISKFDYDIRSQITIIIKSDFDDDNNNKKSSTNELIVCNEPKNSDGIKSQESTKTSSNGEMKTEFPMLPSLDELTAACGEKILNPDFLLHGGGVPFSESSVDDEELNKHLDKKDSSKETANNIEISCTLKTSSREGEKMMSPIQKDVASPQLPSPIVNYDPNKNETLKSEEDQSNDTNNNDGKMEIFEDELTPKRPIITLKSRKMKGLKDLLLAEKLNTNAISLQITAQSHIGNKKSRSEESTGDGSRPKRTRRE